jgi:hypothetical protein
MIVLPFLNRIQPPGKIVEHETISSVLALLDVIVSGAIAASVRFSLPLTSS